MREAHLTIDRSALLHNLQQVKQAAPNSKVLAMVKANAYGHGALLTAQILAPHVDALGVAFLAEALALRAGGITAPIAILEGIFSADELEQALTHDCYLVVHQQQQIDWLRDYQGAKKTSVWLKIDSGMHRLGFSPDKVVDAYQQLQALPVVDDIIMTSHFACADEPASAKTRQQLDCLNATYQQLPALSRSFANSAGILAWPESHHDWVRPGIMLYGCSPFADQSAAELNLQPVMTLKTRLIAMQHIQTGETVGYGAGWSATRETRLGVIAIGYGDGYPRHIRANTPVLVNGQQTVIVARVSMDMVTVDLTDIDANLGDEVILWGEGLSADIIATQAQTISYELFCQVTERVERLVI